MVVVVVVVGLLLLLCVCWGGGGGGDSTTDHHRELRLYRRSENRASSPANSKILLPVSEHSNCERCHIFCTRAGAPPSSGRSYICAPAVKRRSINCVVSPFASTAALKSASPFSSAIRDRAWLRQFLASHHFSRQHTNNKGNQVTNVQEPDVSFGSLVKNRSRPDISGCKFFVLCKFVSDTMIVCRSGQGTFKETHRLAWVFTGLERQDGFGGCQVCDRDAAKKFDDGHGGLRWAGQTQYCDRWHRPQKVNTRTDRLATETGLQPQK